MDSDQSREEKIKTHLEQLPDAPGVYKFLNRKGKILYIGKAKNLKKRVRSYFAGNQHSYRISSMVAQAHEIQFTVTPSESEALLLENNLIKDVMPRYNINLKDGKTYPYICIRNEAFPRVFPTRKKVNDGSLYFGPYSSVKSMEALLELVRHNFKLRTCNLPLNEKTISAKKFQVCLEYQLGNCGGPCEGLMSEAAYMTAIDSVKKILRGHMGQLLAQLESQMMDYASRYEYEKAEGVRVQIEKISTYKRRNTVFPEIKRDVEVLAIDSMDPLWVVTHLRVSEGTIVRTHSWEIRKREELEGEVLAEAYTKFLQSDPESSLEVVSNFLFEPEEAKEGLKVRVPVKGDEKKLVDFALRNCKVLLQEKILKQNFRKFSPEDSALEILRKDLGMKSLPMHIECFDNSNIQGTLPVASLVVFKEGKPAKKDYRHFKIKTVEGPDDFASMAEIVHRRYSRVLEENQPMPDLIVVDGGKGQLSSAAESLEKLGLLGKVPLIGIAKRLEEIYFLNDSVPLHIDKRSPSLKLLQRIRNEAHRFAITFHRDLRSKQATNVTLEKIQGIGHETATSLLRHFKSLKKLRLANESEISEVIGPAKARVIMDAISKFEI
jgi:excinuclease ABC subunit C